MWQYTYHGQDEEGLFTVHVRPPGSSAEAPIFDGTSVPKGVWLWLQ